jgi:Undecaprenyl-phosphate glucose phosphotransferase
MLKKHAQFFKSLFFICDLLILSLSWVLAYSLRVNMISNEMLGPLMFPDHLRLLLPLWVLWGLISAKIRLYRPRRVEYFQKEFWDVIKALTITLLVLITVIYLLSRLEFPRLIFLYFWLMGLLGLTSVRILTRKTLKGFRKRGYNQRFALIAGTGKLGQELLGKIELYPELGIQVIGYLTKRAEEVGRMIKKTPVVGTYDNLDDLLERNRVDICFIALPNDESDRVSSLITKLQGYLADIKVVPGAYEFLRLGGGVDELDNLPIVSLQNSPLYGWNRVSKRVFDLGFGSLALIATFPILLVTSVLIKMTSKGPILYRQERIGMDGRSFQMLKFRTMRVDAEKETGPVWAKEDDPRRTRIGALLRRTSLDELPQLFNVVKGEMSLVGPRPERPIFVEKFRSSIPSYILRHKIKAGMTGLAQVNGFRGNTSIEKRIEHDLYYIEHWSIALDLRILFMTLWTGFFSKSAY